MNTHIARLAGAAVIAALVGCAPVSPAFQLKFEEATGADAGRKYTTLVVKEFENDVGEGVPPGLLRELPEAVIARLNECYPQAFEKIGRKTSGSPGELVVSGTITEYDEGNRFARFMIGGGAGSSKLAVDISLADPSGTVLTRAEGRWVYAIGGWIGAVGGMVTLVDLIAGIEIADGIAQIQGARMAAKCADASSPGSEPGRRIP